MSKNTKSKSSKVTAVPSLPRSSVSIQKANNGYVVSTYTDKGEKY